jgi:hypothetical protein
VVRGLAPSSLVDHALTVRCGRERAFSFRARTLPAHRHVVINEVLAHPPSGSSAQRFVELVNAGDRPASLVGLRLVDGETELPLPSLLLAPSAFVLITPSGFVDGLGGDAPIARATPRVTVDALKLGSGLTLLDDHDVVLSRFPGSTSTRTASRGRRTPDHPDDAPDAFGFDASGRATPGAKNAL